MSDAGRAVKTVQVGTPEYADVANRLIQSNRQGQMWIRDSWMTCGPCC